MKVKTVHYRRTFNLGNYENLSVELVADLNDGDDPAATITELAQMARDWKDRGKK